MRSDVVTQLALERTNQGVHILLARSIPQQDAKQALVRTPVHPRRIGHVAPDWVGAELLDVRGSAHGLRG